MFDEDTKPQMPGASRGWTIPNIILFMEAPRRLPLSIKLTFHFSK